MIRTRRRVLRSVAIVVTALASVACDGGLDAVTSPSEPRLTGETTDPLGDAEPLGILAEAPDIVSAELTVTEDETLRISVEYGAGLDARTTCTDIFIDLDGSQSTGQFFVGDLGADSRIELRPANALHEATAKITPPNGDMPVVLGKSIRFGATTVEAEVPLVLTGVVSNRTRFRMRSWYEDDTGDFFGPADEAPDVGQSSSAFQ